MSDSSAPIIPVIEGWTARQSMWWRPEGDPSQFMLERAGNIGYGVHVEGAVTIEASYHRPGSPPPAFGLTVHTPKPWQWPHVKLDISFCNGEEAKRDDFVADLQQFLNRWLSEHR